MAEQQTVLIVEDDPDLRMMTMLMLEDTGYRVSAARDGHEALRLVAEQMPALILLDMRMPEMNGWQFAAAFREQYGRAAPIVVVTAARDAAIRAQEIDAEGYLNKPFDMDVLIATVARFVSQPQDAAGTPD